MRDLAFVALGFCLFGCAGAVFPYHYYGMADIDYSEGTLLGPEPKDDLSFKECEPTEQVKHPCVIMKAVDFFKLKQDYMDVQNKLISCEHGMKIE